MTGQQILPSHVAVLVPSVRKAADYLRQFDFQIGKEEDWDSEGTVEIYVSPIKGQAETVRCECGTINFNLRPKQ